MHHDTCVCSVYAIGTTAKHLDKIPNPVCCAITNWSNDSIGHCWFMPKTGVDYNKLYWKSLRPFGEDEEVYLVGDIFPATVPNSSYRAFSEGALLTSERLLYTYFKLDPYVDIDPSYLNNSWFRVESV